MLKGKQTYVTPREPNRPDVAAAPQDFDCVASEIPQVAPFRLGEAVNVVRIVHGAATHQTMRTCLLEKA